MTIAWNTNVNAPCIGEIVAQDGRTILVQTDYEYPSVASSFGWSLTDVQVRRRGVHCHHRATDGTIDCPDCPVKALAFIQRAGEWLRENDGMVADDPGYFAEA